MPTFQFHHVWRLPAEPDRVFEVLADVERYAQWWPQVRSAERIDDQSGRTAIRSFLPYTLHLVLRREVEDRATGRLRVAVGGDLEGWCEWQVRPARGGSASGGNGSSSGGNRSGGTVAEFDQEAILTPALLARTAHLTGPLLRANHGWMMRSGRAGLVGHLASRL